MMHGQQIARIQHKIKLADPSVSTVIELEKVPTGYLAKCVIESGASIRVAYISPKSLSDAINHLERMVNSYL